MLQGRNSIWEENAKYSRYAFITTYVPAQHPLSHGCTSLSDPTQSLPPCAGAGLLHSRVRVRYPLPHITLHFPNTQDPQPPFTVNANISTDYM